MLFTFNPFLKRIFPKTLLARFMLIIIIPILIGQLIAVYLFYQRHWYNVSNHMSELIVKEISSLLVEKKYTLNPYSKMDYLNLKYKFIPTARIPNSSKLNNAELKIFEGVIKSKIAYPYTITLTSSGKVMVFLQLNNGILQIILPSKSLLNPTTYIFVSWVLFLTFLLLTVSLIFSKNQIKSILELTKVAEGYGRGEKNINYKPSGAKEVRKAGIAFLKMKDHIEREATKRTQMLAMISHDLNTPLTRIKLQVELMSDSQEKEELKQDIESMHHMIVSYLDFARGEGGEDFISIDLNYWFKEYILRKWDKENIEFLTTNTARIVKIKPHSFERAITNLISNAIKHSTKVKISIYSSNYNVIIDIEDNGKGIKDEEKKNVFKPFYREDKSRSLDNSASVGLGLAITQEIITGHYGTINLEDSPTLKGLLVKIQLPRI